MQVIEEPFHDEAGDEVYSGVVYRLLFGEREFHVRRYDDTPGIASLICLAGEGGQPRYFFEAVPYHDSDFREAVKYLRDVVGADTITILLTEGYRPVDLKRIPGLATDALHCFRCRAAVPDGLDACPACGWTWGEGRTERRA